MAGGLDATMMTSEATTTKLSVHIYREVVVSETDKELPRNQEMIKRILRDLGIKIVSKMTTRPSDNDNELTHRLSTEERATILILRTIVLLAPVNKGWMSPTPHHQRSNNEVDGFEESSDSLLISSLKTRRFCRRKLIRPIRSLHRFGHSISFPVVTGPTTNVDRAVRRQEMIASWIPYSSRQPRECYRSGSSQKWTLRLLLR